MTFRAALMLPLAVLALAGCGPKINPGTQKVANHVAGSVEAPVSVHFAAKVNGAAFDCNQVYPDVGTTKAAYQPADFRLYVSSVRLVRANGDEVALKLIDDGLWQRAGAALIDFEDKTGTCINGTPEKNLQLVGSAPDYTDYTGLRFVMGLPFAVNHQDATAAEPPFDQAGLFWNWQLGYKFLTVDGKANAKTGHAVHVGSTGCTLSAPNEVTDCSAPNITEVTLTPFNAATQTVVADLGVLVAETDITKMPMPMTMPMDPNMAMDPSMSANPNMKPMAMPAGCMSEAKNAECAPIFQVLGLPFGTATADPNAQRFFSVQ